MKNWCVVVVGDKKVRKYETIFRPPFLSLVATLIMTSMEIITMTFIYHCITAQSPPTYDISSDTLVFLSLEEQGEITRHQRDSTGMHTHVASLSLLVIIHRALAPVTEALPYNIIPLLRWNHFGRKNIGFLYAMHHGAEMIYDTDDDNILKVDSEGNPFIPDSSLGELASSKDVVRPGQSHVYNPYPSFDSVPVKDGSPAFVWSRGFPVNLTTGASTWNVSRGVEEGTHEGGVITIVQSLADHDPDVDALYRLTSHLPLSFRSGRSARLEVIPPGVMTPFNAQATAFGKAGFWGMLLPITVHGRVSDIWRSYITGMIMWEARQRVAFASPFVTQVRDEWRPDPGRRGLLRPLFAPKKAIDEAGPLFQNQKFRGKA
jgi:hypothetical protein